jgi:hypothetical protein
VTVVNRLPWCFNSERGKARADSYPLAIRAYPRVATGVEHSSLRMALFAVDGKRPKRARDPVRFPNVVPAL